MVGADLARTRGGWIRSHRPVPRDGEVVIPNGLNSPAQFRGEPCHTGKTPHGGGEKVIGGFGLELGRRFFSSPKFEPGAKVLSTHFPRLERDRTIDDDWVALVQQPFTRSVPGVARLNCSGR